MTVRSSSFYVYIVACADATYYTGWTTDIVERVRAHNTSTRGAKYTRARRPVTLVYLEECATSTEARIREASIKSLSRSAKSALVARYVPQRSLWKKQSP
jgi:putative endonuclease